MGARKSLVLLGLVIALANVAAAQIPFAVAHERFTTPPKALFVAGSFNGMSTTATSMTCEGKVWRTAVKLPDGRHYYKFHGVDAKGAPLWLNDPVNPFLADDGKHGAYNFIDVQGGKIALNFEGLERFQLAGYPQAKWVCVAGDFNDWYLGQYRLAQQPDGSWVGFLPIRRPFAYKFIIDGIWRLDPDRAGSQAVPNGIGESNSWRPQANVREPSQATITRTIQAGEAAELDRITSLAREADYGGAVALARKVAEVNTEAQGSTAPIVLKARALEGRIHKRWNRWSDAAACWRQLADSGVVTPETVEGIRELAMYYLYIAKDREAGRQLVEIAVGHAADNVEMVKTISHWFVITLREGNPELTIQSLDETLALLPTAQQGGKPYACELSELWLIKAAAHYRLGQRKQAREAYLKILEVHPYEDGLNPQRARTWLARHDEEGNPLPPTSPPPLTAPPGR